MFRKYKEILIVSVHRLYIVFRSETHSVPFGKCRLKGGGIPRVRNVRAIF